MDMKLIPRISEKSYAQAAEGTYVFNVPMKANKQLISDAVAAQFNVKVTDVRVVVSKGKAKQVYRKGGKPVAGKRPDNKKAYITLAEGDKIALFEEKK